MTSVGWSWTSCQVRTYGDDLVIDRQCANRLLRICQIDTANHWRVWRDGRWLVAALRWPHSSRQSYKWPVLSHLHIKFSFLFLFLSCLHLFSTISIFPILHFIFRIFKIIINFFFFYSASCSGREKQMIVSLQMNFESEFELESNLNRVRKSCGAWGGGEEDNNLT